MKVTALAGGVGGAKLLVGLQRAAGGDATTAIVNTGDDAIIYGVHVSPDVDIVTYWLAGIADTQRGWGIAGDTFHLTQGLGKLGVDNWFSLGDRDFATCVLRTERLRQGATLSAVTDEVRRALGVEVTILPMSDDRVGTMVATDDGRTLDFQTYFVKEQTRPNVAAITYEGVEDAKPGPAVLDAIDNSDIVVLCPSNPVLSIGPIVAVPGIRDRLIAHPRVVAVSPIVQGRALKGPADRVMNSLGLNSSASGVAALYVDFCDIFVVDESDGAELDLIEGDIRAIALPTIMNDHEASQRLAGAILSL